MSTAWMYGSVALHAMVPRDPIRYEIIYKRTYLGATLTPDGQARDG